MGDSKNRKTHTQNNKSKETNKKLSQWKQLHAMMAYEYTNDGQMFPGNQHCRRTRSSIAELRTST